MKCDTMPVQFWSRHHDQVLHFFLKVTHKYKVQWARVHGFIRIQNICKFDKKNKGIICGAPF
jgi:hypothetical protein